MAYVNLTGLKKARKYNITVSAFNQHGDGPPSEILDVKTEEDKPDAAPQNVTAVKKTSNSILVTWDEVPNGKRNGRIQKYRVDYTSAADNEQKSKEVNASIKYLEINGLQHNTKYSTAVSASTSKGYGPASKPIFVATDQDGTPSAPPQIVRAVNKTINSIGVTWDEVPESHRNGDILRYTVSYHLVIPGDYIKEKSFDVPTRFANLENLSSNTNYSITVLASNQHGNGPPSVPTFVTTSNGSDFQCPPGDDDRIFKDPNSCFRFYRCDSGNAIHRTKCAEGTEFRPSSSGANPCDHPGEPYCHV
ncbi:neogenin-like isoform X2 [Oculina patagonica]